MDIDNKKKTIDTVVSNIDKNYDALADVIETEYGFIALEPVRYEICICLICGLNQAALTLTNHLLESALKKFLILAHAKENGNCERDITNVFDEATKLYADRNLKVTIDISCSKGLINKYEKKLLHSFREKYRNGFTHSDPTKMFHSDPISMTVVNVDDRSTLEELLSKIYGKPNAEVNPQTALILQGLLQSITADVYAKDYFLKVDEIIRNIIVRMHDSM